MSLHRCFTILTLATAVFSNSLSFADGGTTTTCYVPSSREIIYGVFVNPNNDGILMPQKVIYYYWGYGEVYRKIADVEQYLKFGFTLVDKWSTEDSNTWYRSYSIYNSDLTVSYLLYRFSSDGSVLECVEKIGDFPTESDLVKKNYIYKIYYRK